MRWERVNNLFMPRRQFTFRNPACGEGCGCGFPCSFCDGSGGSAGEQYAVTFPAGAWANTIFCTTCTDYNGATVVLDFVEETASHCQWQFKEMFCIGGVVAVTLTVEASQVFAEVSFVSGFAGGGIDFIYVLADATPDCLSDLVLDFDHISSGFDPGCDAATYPSTLTFEPV